MRNIALEEWNRKCKGTRPAYGYLKMGDEPGRKMPFWMLSRPTLDSLWFAKFHRQFNLKMKRAIKELREIK